MAGGERGHLVEEKQLGVIGAPDIAMPVRVRTAAPMC
jgi:hypothetical protein